MIHSKTLALFLAGLLVVLTGCVALPRIATEIPLAPSTLSLEETRPGSTKFVLFNNSNRLLGIDGSCRLNIRINGSGVTQLNIGEFVQFFVRPGGYEFHLVHLDGYIIESTHTIEAQGDIVLVEVNATAFSNSATVVDVLPKDFLSDFVPVHAP